MEPLFSLTSTTNDCGPIHDRDRTCKREYDVSFTIGAVGHYRTEGCFLRARLVGLPSPRVYNPNQCGARRDATLDVLRQAAAAFAPRLPPSPTPASTARRSASLPRHSPPNSLNCRRWTKLRKGRGRHRRTGVVNPNVEEHGGSSSTPPAADCSPSFHPPRRRCTGDRGPEAVVRKRWRAATTN